MLVEQTMEKLVAMQLKGMAEALRRWMEEPKEKEMTPLDLAGLLADAEWRHREQRKLTGRLRTARFRQDACVEDIFGGGHERIHLRRSGGSIHGCG